MPCTKPAYFDSVELQRLRERQLSERWHELEQSRVVIAVDMSQSNISKANGWGNGSLHAPHATGMWAGRDEPVATQSPYRRALELIGQRALSLPKSAEGVTLLPFADKVLHEATCTRATLLSEYDKFAAHFNQGQIVQKQGTSLGAPIYKAIEYSVRGKEHVILVILTDGNLPEIGEASEALIAASHFPVSICTVGIGDSQIAAKTFDQYINFDQKLFERDFDNLHHVNFEYFFKSGDEFHITAVGMCPMRREILEKFPEGGEESQQEVRFNAQVFEEVFEQLEEIARQNLIKYMAKITLDGSREA